MTSLEIFESKLVGRNVIVVSNESDTNDLNGAYCAQIDGIEWMGSNKDSPIVRYRKDGEVFFCTGIVVPDTEDIKSLLRSFTDAKQRFRTLSSLLSVHHEISIILTKIKEEHRIPPNVSILKRLFARFGL